jgi:hypothetical protein
MGSSSLSGERRLSWTRMPWCCEEFESHLGTFTSDNLRVNYAMLFPPASGRKLFWLERQNSGPSRFSVALGAFVISPLPSHLVRAIANSRTPSLHGHYPASSLLRVPPPPSHLPPISRVLRLYGFPAPPISQRGEEGFSSCLARSCHRAAAITPPEWLAASVRCDDPCCLRPPVEDSAPG